MRLMLVFQKLFALLSISAWGVENSDVLIQINNVLALDGHSQMFTLQAKRLVTPAFH